MTDNINNNQENNQENTEQMDYEENINALELIYELNEETEETEEIEETEETEVNADISNNLQWSEYNHTPSSPYINSVYNSIYQSIFNTILNSPTTQTNNFINNTLYTKSKYKKILSSEGEYDLEKIQYNSNNNYNNTCPIYQINFEENEEIIKLPCNHCFTPEAIIKWLKEEQALCPVCRYELKSIEVKDQESDLDEEIADTQTSNLYPNNTTNETTPLLNQYATNISNQFNLLSQVNPSDLTYSHPPFSNIDISNLENLIDSLTRSNSILQYRLPAHRTNEQQATTRFHSYIANSYIQQEEEELQQALMESLLPEYMNSTPDP